MYQVNRPNKQKNPNEPLISANLPDNKSHAIRSIRPIVLNHPINPDYNKYLKSYKSTNHSASTLEPKDSKDLISDLISYINQNIDSYDISATNHNKTNYTAVDTITLLVDLILSSMSSLNDQVFAEIGKNSGSANKRRNRAIKQFKTNVADFRLLLTSTRQSIGSTNRERRYIQDHIDDETKYIESAKKGSIEYLSKSYFSDFNSIIKILNSDLHFSHVTYQVVKSRLNRFNQLIHQFNTSMGQSLVEEQ